MVCHLMKREPFSTMKYAIQFFDPEPSTGEDRFVCHCFRLEETGIPYQTLINLYLRDCAVHQRKLKMQWAS